eukprot:GHVN01055460.1.p1 GENE.GHVN01055460.1~~GHVN01055460.1.p1  ORF type:complete len:373 (-),score=66.81 GHVN01055460.1:465-1583(-)
MEPTTVAPIMEENGAAQTQTEETRGASDSPHSRIDMEKYRKVAREKAVIKEDEIRVTSQGRLQNYISYASKIFHETDPEKNNHRVVIKATGNAIARAVSLAEVLKRRIPGLHQETTCGSTTITDVYEPLEGTEGLEKVTQQRMVSSIELLLTKEVSEVNLSAPGYQEPLDPSLVQELSKEEFLRGPPREGGDRGRGRGRGRGGGYRGGYRGRRGGPPHERSEGEYRHEDERDGGGVPDERDSGRGRGRRGRGGSNWDGEGRGSGGRHVSGGYRDRRDFDYDYNGGGGYGRYNGGGMRGRRGGGGGYEDSRDYAPRSGYGPRGRGNYRYHDEDGGGRGGVRRPRGGDYQYHDGERSRGGYGGRRGSPRGGGGY